jgi:hypothetical protein
MNSIFLSLLQWKAQDEARFSTLTELGPFEIRLYQRLFCAKLPVKGPFEEAFHQGVAELNDYIEGCNFKVEKIPNAGPYFHSLSQESWELGVILPSGFLAEDWPLPINRKIRLMEIPPGRVSVLRFKGTISKELILRKQAELQRWLNLKGLRPFGQLRVYRHDLTLPVPFFRHNELHLDII